VRRILSARETFNRLFSDRDSLTQKGKQHGQHKHYHGYTLRTIDRCNRAGIYGNHGDSRCNSIDHAAHTSPKCLAQDFCFTSKLEMRSCELGDTSSNQSHQLNKRLVVLERVITILFFVCHSIPSRDRDHLAYSIRLLVRVIPIILISRNPGRDTGFANASIGCEVRSYSTVSVTY